MKKLIIFLNLFIVFQSFGQKLEYASPETLQMNTDQFRYADEAIRQAIENGDIPGAVLTVVYQNKIVYNKAFGNKQIYPTKVAMEVNSVFDLASLTKPISTATSIFILIERGKICLTDKVSRHIPDFSDDIRIIDLLTHTSGLPAYPPVDSLQKELDENPRILIDYLANCKRKFKPKTGFQYSCLNYVVLQKIIESVSGQNLRDFAKENIFDILGMENTDYCPSGELLKKTAPTERQADKSILCAIVHDPLARILANGISGNAGLFSNTEDLAVFSTALLNGGIYDGKRILSSQSVKIMTSVPYDIFSYGRTPGWDSHSVYASNQGDLLSPQTYGHTGYTGTSLVIDPDNKLAIILLTNRVHPEDKTSVTRLRSVIANIVAASIPSI